MPASAMGSSASTVVSTLCDAETQVNFLFPHDRSAACLREGDEIRVTCEVPYRAFINAEHAKD